MATATAILDTLRTQLDITEYKKLHWEGIVRGLPRHRPANTPGVTRTAYQRLYDMILSHGTEDVYENKDKIIRYKFFAEFAARHGDGIYGLDRPLMQLVNTFKSAAQGYGTERRVLLLHGPVGSSKSTIARLLKNGLEEYSPDRRRACSSPSPGRTTDGTWPKDPMHDEPLQLIPARAPRPRSWPSSTTSRKRRRLRGRHQRRPLPVLPVRCSTTRLDKYDGDWRKMLANEVKVYRLILSEKDRIGIGTFQPKDEKNQDSPS